MLTRSVRDYSILAERKPMRIYAFAQNTDIGSFLAFEAADSAAQALKQAREVEPYANYQKIASMDADSDPELFMELVMTQSAITPHANDYKRLNALLERLK